MAPKEAFVPPWGPLTIRMIATGGQYAQGVRREMRYTAERTATNVLVMTLHGMVCGIRDTDGRAVRRTKKVHKVFIDPKTLESEKNAARPRGRG